MLVKKASSATGHISTAASAFTPLRIVSGSP